MRYFLGILFVIRLCIFFRLIARCLSLFKPFFFHVLFFFIFFLGALHPAEISLALSVTLQFEHFEVQSNLDVLCVGLRFSLHFLIFPAFFSVCPVPVLWCFATRFLLQLFQQSAVQLLLCFVRASEESIRGGTTRCWECWGNRHL